MSTGQILVGRKLRKRRRFRIGLVGIGFLADDDGGGHHLVGIFRTIEQVGLVEILALFGLADQFDQMLGRELGGGQFDAVLLRFVDIDLEPLGFLRRGALDLLVEILVDEGFRHELKRSCLRRPRKWSSAGRSAWYCRW